MVYCRHCGTGQEPLKFCKHCGKPLDVPAAPAPTAPAGEPDFFNSLGSLDGGLSDPTPTPAAPPPVHTAPVTPPPVRTAPVTPPPVRTAPVAPPPVRTAPVTPPPTSTTPPVSPAPAAVRERVKPMRRISVGRELRLLLRQGILILFGDKRNLIISLLFPLIAGGVTVWVAGENMFRTQEGTKSACFILVCAAIWCGLFNSIQSLVKERDNIKRDYVSGALRIECYMGSRAIIQLALCALQALVLTISIPAMTWFYDSVSLPHSGVLGDWILLEYYISLFMVMLASDAMGLMISSMVKKEELASKLAPYILIAQLLFSGMLFKMEGFAEIFSAIMISRWGMEALGSISSLNTQVCSVHYSAVREVNGNPSAYVCPQSGGKGICTGTNNVLEFLKKPEGPSDSFDASSEHLWMVWLIMVAFVVVCLVAADLLLHRVKKDGRD